MTEVQHDRYVVFDKATRRVVNVMVWNGEEVIPLPPELGAVQDPGASHQIGDTLQHPRLP